MKFALIIDGVIDAISFEPQPDPWVSVPYDVFAGFLWDGQSWRAPAGPTAEEMLATERAAMSLSFAQLLIGLVTEGWITAAEGRSWRDRVALPDPVVNLITSLPVEQQFAAETRAFAPSAILRLDPLVVGLGLHTGKTPEQIDEFFRKYTNA